MPRWLLFVAISILTAIAVHWSAADLFHPSLDEGIYLEGGHRVATGQVPYRDFFAFTGPLIYLVQAALEHLLGRDLAMLRWSLAFSLGILAASVFAIVETYTNNRAAGAAAAIFCLAIFLSAPNRLVINHRWLSAALFAAALAVAVHALDRPRLHLATGLLAALAAWTTPSFAPALLLLVLTTRSLWLLAGAGLASLPLLAWLLQSSALAPLLERLLWASRQYAAANSVPFAYYPGSVPLSLNALRPFVAVAVILAGLLAAVFESLRTRDRRDLLLAAGVFGCLVTAYPRWDVLQLPYVLAPALAAAVICAHRRLPVPALHAALLLAMLWSAYQGIRFWSYRDALTAFPTRAGYLLGESAHALALEALEKHVPPGSALFVFPYLPTFGYLLDTRNPTSFSYLQPGMMSAADEAQALRELSARPPRFVLRQYFPDDQVLLTWPNSDRARLSLASIRGFLDSHYRFVEHVESRHFALDLLELKASSTP